MCVSHLFQTYYLASLCLLRNYAQPYSVRGGEKMSVCLRGHQHLTLAIGAVGDTKQSRVVCPKRERVTKETTDSVRVEVWKRILLVSCYKRHLKGSQWPISNSVCIIHPSWFFVSLSLSLTLESLASLELSFSELHKLSDQLTGDCRTIRRLELLFNALFNEATA